MFKQNKYSHWYYTIIQTAKSRDLPGYYEAHHIIPRCMGGTDGPDNLVNLTAREHFICHMLLVRMTEADHYRKLLHAYIMMSGRRTYNSRQYMLFRKEYSIVNSQLRQGSNNGMYGSDRKGEKNTFFGKRHTEETKQKISLKKKGHSTNKGIPKSMDHRLKISKSRKEAGKKFSFLHQTLGTFFGSLRELREKFPEQHLRSDELWKLSAGKYKSYKGWALA